MSDHITADSDGGQTVPESKTSNTPQNYEQWKRQHGYQSKDPKPRLEVGQRVKAAHPLSEDDYYNMEWDGDEPPQTVEEGALGIVTATHETHDYMYEVQFDSGIKWWACWTKDSELEDGWEGGAEIKPVGKSPSQIAAEKAEQERLSQYRQLSLFDAQRGESEAG